MIMPGMCLMAKCLLIQDNNKEAASYATAAIQIYPTEPRTLRGRLAHVGTVSSISFGQFSTCDRCWPGNPQLTFYMGYSRENMGRRQAAAANYADYLKMVNYQSNKYSQHAYQRLKEWGICPVAGPKRGSGIWWTLSGP